MLQCFPPLQQKTTACTCRERKGPCLTPPWTNSNQTPKNGWLEDYCWWFRNPAITTCDGVKTLLVIQDIYQRQLVIAGFIPTTVFVVCFWVSADFQGRFRCYYMECNDLKQPPTWKIIPWLGYVVIKKHAVCSLNSNDSPPKIAKLHGL